MITGNVSRVSTQRNAFGEVFVEVNIQADGGSEIQYFTRDRVMVLLASAQMLRPETSNAKIQFEADGSRWLTSVRLL